MASKCLPGISLININLPQNKIRMIKLKEKVKELSDDSTDTFKRNIIDRYIDHPVCCKFAYSKNVCLAQFAAYYYKKSISENDCQPDLLEEDISDKDIDFSIGLPTKITLKNIHEIMIRRNQRLEMRYHKPNSYLRGKIVNRLLVIFYPFLKENDLFSSDQTYLGKSLDPKVCAIVNENKQIFEPNSELIDTSLTETSMQDQ